MNERELLEHSINILHEQLYKRVNQTSGAQVTYGNQNVYSRNASYGTGTTSQNERNNFDNRQGTANVQTKLNLKRQNNPEKIARDVQSWSDRYDQTMEKIENTRELMRLTPQHKRPKLNDKIRKMMKVQAMQKQKMEYFKREQQITSSM